MHYKAKIAPPPTVNSDALTESNSFMKWFPVHFLANDSLLDDLQWSKVFMEQKNCFEPKPVSANYQIANLCYFALIMAPNKECVIAEQNGTKSNFFASIESTRLVILEKIFCVSEI